MFTCYGTHLGLAPGAHQHSETTEAKRCYGLLPVSAPSYPSAPAPITSMPVGAPFRFGSRTAPSGPLSQAQFNYIKDLKGDTAEALKMTYTEASIYITKLRGGKTVTSGSYTDPRLEMLKSLVEMVPDGYYAVQEFEGGHVEFIRVSLPKNGKYRGSRKFQTLHGSGLGAKLTLAATLWPSGSWSLYRTGFTEKIMLLVADYQGAALRYAEKLGKCARCNAELTDGRSRFYGIGPECEQHWPWFIPQVEETKGQFAGQR